MHFSSGILQYSKTRLNYNSFTENYVAIQLAVTEVTV